MTRITALDVVDVRFPTSLGLDGSDAMNPEPDYSAAYVVLRTDDPRRRRLLAALHDRPRATTSPAPPSAPSRRTSSASTSTTSSLTSAPSPGRSPGTGSCGGSARRRA